MRYQQAVPIPRGKLAMLLFLSTEVMFFTALIGSYIVLRFAAKRWPAADDVQVNVWLGILNTLILVGSGLTMAAALRETGQGRPSSAKSWLLVSFVLGTAFLGIKFWEYQSKYQHGIFPASTRSLMYDQADELYLARAVAELRLAIKRLEQQPTSESREDRLRELYLIQAGVIDWTQYKVGRSGDDLMNRRAMETLAHQINPLTESPELEKYLFDESREVGSQRKQLETELADAEAMLKETQQQLKVLLPQKDSAEVEIRNQFDRESQNATRWVNRISALRTQLDPFVNREAALAKLDGSQGINDQFDLKLPMVIPGGNTWASAYYLLTVSHALHLLVGLLVVAWLIPIRLSLSMYNFMDNLVLYWYFVDLVWLVIFAIVYLS